jgi:hypothetical protein
MNRFHERTHTCGIMAQSATALPNSESLRGSLFVIHRQASESTSSAEETWM